MKFSLLFFDFFSQIKDRITHLLHNRYLIKLVRLFQCRYQYSEEVLKKRSINEDIHITFDFLECPHLLSQIVRELNGKMMFRKFRFNIPANAEVEEFVISEPFLRKRVSLIVEK